ncbi:hypothetical protein [Mesobacillus foraminis]|uniref:hypothetical protein n=1 Tax=Mesobacillus foraminis TaxID=279826 RepID=UPI000EF47C90|nr:hypothetical protein [Mesobacillus foraminis]
MIPKVEHPRRTRNINLFNVERVLLQGDWREWTADFISLNSWQFDNLNGLINYDPWLPGR